MSGIGTAEFKLQFCSTSYPATGVSYLKEEDSEDITGFSDANFIRFEFDGGDTDEIFYLEQVVEVSGNAIPAETVNNDEATIFVYIPAALS